MLILRYSNGQSEVVLGRALKEIGMPRENVVILTKVRPNSFVKGRLTTGLLPLQSRSRPQ